MTAREVEARIVDQYAAQDEARSAWLKREIKVHARCSRCRRVLSDKSLALHPGRCHRCAPRPKRSR